MKPIRALPLLLLIWFVTAMQAQAPAPKPDAQLNKLHAFVGHWTMEGETLDGPLGPGGKFTGEYTAQMILGGFFLEAQWTEKDSSGVSRSLEITGYDPATKNLVSHGYGDDGGGWSGVMTLSGSTWTYRGTNWVAGKPYRSRSSDTFAPDLMSITSKFEVSTDGTTWQPVTLAKWTKVPAAPKK